MSINIYDSEDHELASAVQRVNAVIASISANKKLIKNGMGFLAEPEQRLKLFLDRQRKLANQNVRVHIAPDHLPAHVPDDELEKYIGKINNILSIEFLELGVLAARSVGKLSSDVETGTGFHIGNGIIITNHHVISSRNECQFWSFELNVEDNKFGKPKTQVSYYLNPDRFFLTSEEYDFTLVAVEATEGSPSLEYFGWHALNGNTGKILIGHPVNVIQHPGNKNKAVVLHDSHLVYVDDYNSDMEKYCLYTSDTEPGSSGSPVFNCQWEVIALHHKSIPKTDKNGNLIDEFGKQIIDLNKKYYIANEGIRISRVVRELKCHIFPNPHEHEIRDDLLKLWSRPGSHLLGLRSAIQTGSI